MNPIYSLLESPHRWSILAAISFTVGTVGAMAMIAYGWSHVLSQVWFYAGTIATVAFLARAFLDWYADVDQSV